MRAWGWGGSLTFGSALAAGYYRLDVTGFAADGKRAGSATVNFQVTGSAGSQSSIGSLLLPEQAGYHFAAISPTMAYDPQRNLGLSIFRLGRTDSATFETKYTLGMSGFRSSRTVVQCAPVVTAYSVEENVHPGNNMPIAFDPAAGVFLINYVHGGYVLRAVRVNTNLSVEMGPELVLSSSIGLVAAISPDATSGKILIFGQMSVVVAHLQGLTVQLDFTVDYPYNAYLTGMNKQALQIVNRSLHVFFIQQTQGPGIILPVRLVSGGNELQFLNAVTIPEATDYFTWQSMSYDPISDAVLCAYRDSSYAGRLSIFPFASGVLTHAGSVIFGNGNEVDNTLYYDQGRGASILVNRNFNDGSKDFLRTITVSGSAPTISPPNWFSGAYGGDISAAYDADDGYGLIEIGSGFFAY